MTTLEGGMITTNDESLDNLARSFRNQGKGGASFGNEHTDLGNSWRLNEIEAAMRGPSLRTLSMRDAAHRVMTRQSSSSFTPKHAALTGLAWVKTT